MNMGRPTAIRNIYGHLKTRIDQNVFLFIQADSVEPADMKGFFFAHKGNNS